MYVFSGDDDELGAGGEAMKFYTLTVAGRRRLRADAMRWKRYAAAVTSALSAPALP
jgi:hypothetical protein